MVESMDTQIITSPSPPPPPSSTTTFVQADKTTFRDLVQKLTGLEGDYSTKLPPTFSTRTQKTSSFPVDPTAPRRSPFKLQERRHNMRKLEIKLGLASLDQSPVISSRRRHRLECSPSLSPVTPLGSELTLSPLSTSSASSEEEERAIAEKGFYLHPSPLSTPTPRGGEPPELLSLFPLSPT